VFFSEHSVQLVMWITVCQTREVMKKFCAVCGQMVYPAHVKLTDNEVCMVFRLVLLEHCSANAALACTELWKVMHGYKNWIFIYMKVKFLQNTTGMFYGHA